MDNRRVVLKIGNVSYIHANYVSSPNNPKRFICTQAPLPKTCPEFWYMVVQEKSKSILMLCNFIEQVSKKNYMLHYDKALCCGQRPHRHMRTLFAETHSFPI
ncbi:unnamed protein product [Heligmosomoides polygyrus]|uniref:Tyrosine-protein phosphatase domain-containing protein n=1 Tax=Heligmosomoides polygyrus TaxID=6339 RepID=A0A3P8C8D1_HELPZ|nr:unnamed protein product [Heligmosomoides polygyrus]